MSQQIALVPKTKQPAAAADAQSECVSLGFWLLALVLLLVPIVNVIAAFILAFVGGNRSRKNFFRAVLVFPLLAFALHLVLVLTVIIAPAAGQWSTDLWNAAVQACGDVWMALLELIPNTE